MGVSNPYRPLESYVADVPGSTGDEGAFVEAGRSVSVGHGWTWITAAYDLFKKRVGVWILIIIILGALIIGLSLIPVVGWLITTLLFPLLTGGLMLGCRALDRDEDFGVGYLFAAFQHRAGQLVVLGAISIAAWMLVFIPVFLVMGGAMFSAMFLGGDPAAVAGVGRDFVFAMLIMFALSIPVYMALWFAPALIVLHDVAPSQAIGQSFRACLKNIFPFLVYGVVTLLLAIAASIPLGLGFLVLGPVIIASIYTAYRDIFFEPA